MLVETGSNQIAIDILQHLSGLLGSKMTATVEINAEIPSGTRTASSGRLQRIAER